MYSRESVIKWFQKQKYEEILTKKIIISKLNNYYSRNNKDNRRIPHYCNWQKENYGINIKIFEKTDDTNTDIPIPYIWIKSEEQFFEYVKYYRKAYAQKAYAEELRQLNNGNIYYNYYNLLKTFITEEILQFAFYDAYIAIRCRKKREESGTIRIYSDGYSIKEEDTQFSCLYDGNNKIHYGNEKNGCTSEEFGTFAKHKIDNTSIQFPYTFNYNVNKENELLLEKNYREIQCELIYNDKLRNYFKRDTRQNLSAYFYKEACNRISPMYPTLDKYDIITREEYLYIIETLTGINLAYCYTKYFTKIKKMTSEQEPDEKISGILFWILDELMDMPNIFTRNQIIKELMEPIIFLDMNIEEGLLYVRQTISDLKHDIHACWTALQDLLNNDIFLKQIEFMYCDIQQDILDNATSTYPFIFAKENSDDEIVSKDFALVFRHIITKS